MQIFLHICTFQYSVRNIPSPPAMWKSALRWSYSCSKKPPPKSVFQLV